jgi:hypothetical protein
MAGRKMIWHEVDKTYVNGWEEGGKAFTYTPHKGLAHAWVDSVSARTALHDTIELHENTLGHIIVDATLTPVQQAVADLLTMSEDDRKRVLQEFCPECYDAHRPFCRRDLDLV